MQHSNHLRLVRILLLVIGAACAALILTISLAGSEYTYDNPILVSQVAFLFVVSMTSLFGIAASAFRPQWLRASRAAGMLFTAPAVLYPLNGLFSLLVGGELNRFLISNMVIEAVAGAVIALAIASAWLKPFQVELANEQS